MNMEKPHKPMPMTYITLRKTLTHATTLASRLAISDLSNTITKSGESALKMTTLVNIKAARRKLMPLQIERTIEPLLNILLSPCDVLCPLFKVYSTSITMVLSGEGFREGLQPS